jgi:hypothetical protein
MASRAPIPATSARLSGGRSIPTSELTFNAKVTSSGAMNSREVLMYASVYSQRVQRDETPSDPVRRGRLRLQRSLGCGSVLQSVQPGGGRQPRAAGGAAIPGPGNVGHCGLLRRHGARRLTHRPLPPAMAGPRAGRTARSPHQSPHVVMRPHHIPFYLSINQRIPERRLRSIHPGNS